MAYRPEIVFLESNEIEDGDVAVCRLGAKALQRFQYGALRPGLYPARMQDDFLPVGQLGDNTTVHSTHAMERGKCRP
jgi:hypothetical protein